MRQFIINSQVVIVKKDWSLTDQLNARTTLSMTVVDKGALSKIENGQTVQLFNDSSKLFEGVITSVEMVEDSPGVIDYNINVTDHSELADRRVIAKVYENKTAGYIARDIIAEKLGDESVTEGDIQEGPLIKKAVFNYKKCSEALNYLCRIAGFSWTIDNDRKLNLFDRLTNLAPYILDNTFPHNEFKAVKTTNQYRNTQYVRGGKAKTALQNNETPTPRPDGESRNFILRFPLALKPKIEVKIGTGSWSEIPESDIGVNGIDKNKKFYFTFNSQIITQDSGELVLTLNDAIRVTYTGLKDLFVMIDSTTEISGRKAVEQGASGVYEELNIEGSINESAQALQYAQGLIETYGQIKDVVSFSTQIDGLKAGQLLTVRKPLYDISEDFLIESVTVRPNGNGLYYTARALDGASIGGWEEFFKRLVSGQKEYVVSADEVVITLQTQTEISGYTGEIFISSTRLWFPNEIIYPSNTLYPGTTESEVSLLD